jgi:hypothetical protein
MGFETPQGYRFRIPVSDTQAYRQFGNSVVVPVFAAVAKLLAPRIEQAVARVSKRLPWRTFTIKPRAVKTCGRSARAIRRSKNGWLGYWRAPDSLPFRMRAARPPGFCRGGLSVRYLYPRLLLASS